MSSLLWNILCWNIRGINSESKCLALHKKIDESNCSIVCLQETKKEDFDHSFFRRCCPKRFDKFEYAASVGAYGGLIIIWCSSQFSGQVIHSYRYALTIKITSVLSN